ncbi:FAD/NAD(P)-binding domain-containing protein [Aureobasidium pullulans]|nr:FAD/NAD(P)-binding domain-containing protein [Aureobasidium pullulans]THY06870.1 FAD/NAD(P)-binding domain-containing protein [Aureobasidium pullulans]
MPHSEETIRIAIAGGGIGGLCLAVGLMDKPNLDVHIYEGVPKYTDIGAGLALHKNAITAMDLIHPAIKKTYFAKALTMAGEEDEEMVTQVVLVSGPNTGEVVAELGKAKGRRTVARADLLDGLLSLLPKDRVTFGKKLDSINEDETNGKVTLTFKDGTTAEADCLLGADGIHSGTRKFLLGADHPAVPPRNSDGWRVHSRQVPMELAMKTIDSRWRRTVPILCGSEGHVNMMPLHMGKTLSIICVTRTGIASDGSIAPFEKERFADYREDAKAAVELVAEDPNITWELQQHDPAPYYSRRNIAMMGDAAHACMPFVGQGAAQAIEDAAVLTALFRRVESVSQVEKALAAYDKVRRPRAQAVVTMGRDFGRLYDFALDGVKDDPVKMKQFMGKGAAFTNNADLEKQNQDAVDAFEALL